MIIFFMLFLSSAFCAQGMQKDKKRKNSDYVDSFKSIICNNFANIELNIDIRSQHDSSGAASFAINTHYNDDLLEKQPCKALGKKKHLWVTLPDESSNIKRINCTVDTTFNTLKFLGCSNVVITVLDEIFTNFSISMKLRNKSKVILKNKRADGLSLNCLTVDSDNSTIKIPKGCAYILYLIARNNAHINAQKLNSKYTTLNAQQKSKIFVGFVCTVCANCTNQSSMKLKSGGKADVACYCKSIIECGSTGYNKRLTGYHDETSKILCDKPQESDIVRSPAPVRNDKETSSPSSCYNPKVSKSL